MINQQLINGQWGNFATTLKTAITANPLTDKPAYRDRMDPNRNRLNGAMGTDLTMKNTRDRRLKR